MLTKDPCEADDLYQDAFLQGYTMVHKIDPDNNPSSFIIAIAVRLWKSKQRRAARRMRILGHHGLLSNQRPDFPNGSDDPVVLNDLTTCLRKLTEELPEKMRLTLLMFYTGDMTIEQIAKEMRIPQGTVKSRLFAAKKKLKSRLEECGYESC